MECTHPVPSFGRFEWVLGLFWPKNGYFWPQIAVFETEVRHLRQPFPAATVSGSYFVWLSLTPISIIHQSFSQIQSTSMEL